MYPSPAQSSHTRRHCHIRCTLRVFAHSITTRANKVKFQHQALCNPKISRLLKATRKGFLKGCPYISEEMILKYLNPSPATAKGCMKRPRYGIKSTTPKLKSTSHISQQIEVTSETSSVYNVPLEMNNVPRPNIITDNSNESIANVFFFGALADKNSGIMYQDMTGNFPFMSLNGCICYLIMYHYKSNAILATPINGMDDVTIFEAYKQNFEMLEAKGFKVKLNVMDNQETKYMIKFLTKNKCKVQLVEPGNKRLNAAERAIQTWKYATHRSNCHHRFGLPTAALGPYFPPSPRLSKFDAPVTNQSFDIRVRGTQRAIRLE